MCVCVCVLHESLDAVQCIHDQCTGYTIPDAALIAIHPFSEVLFESTYHVIGANLNRWGWRVSFDCDSWFVHRVSLIVWLLLMHVLSSICSAESSPSHKKMEKIKRKYDS